MTVHGGHLPDPAARAFDALGADYERAFADLPEQLAALDWLLAELPEGARVLDVGSGTGRPTAERLVAAGHRVTGCDVSTTMVELARERVPGARFELVDVRELPAAPESLDAVTAFFPLLQMPRADQARVLADLADRLVPGGLLAVATVPADVEGVDLVWLGQPVRCTSFPAPAFRALVESTGLRVEHERHGEFTPDFPGAVPEEHLFLLARKPLN
ncbi:class I SAM-dependent methyltransferase [Actinosynnema sp.]|uniref:class I SAM-dependent methyltransferase n=1 Tax=Actinosynnema sp. TaxID=1872144 RepID=UPI003F877C72